MGTHLILASFKGDEYFVETPHGQSLDEAIDLICGDHIGGSIRDVFHLNCGNIENVSFDVASAIASRMRSGEFVCDEALDFGSQVLNEDLEVEARKLRGEAEQDIDPDYWRDVREEYARAAE